MSWSDWTWWSCTRCRQPQYTTVYIAEQEAAGPCKHLELCPESIGERPRCWNGCWINDLGPCRLKLLRRRQPYGSAHETTDLLPVPDHDDFASVLASGFEP